MAFVVCECSEKICFKKCKQTDKQIKINVRTLKIIHLSSATVMLLIIHLWHPLLGGNASLLYAFSMLFRRIANEDKIKWKSKKWEIEREKKREIKWRWSGWMRRKWKTMFKGGNHVKGLNIFQMEKFPAKTHNPYKFLMLRFYLTIFRNLFIALMVFVIKLV